MVSIAASTLGQGRNALRPIVWPTRKFHHGAHAAARKLAGGWQANLIATSRWTITSARWGPRSGWSKSLARVSVVSPNGGFATTRYGSCGIRRFRRSDAITRTFGCCTSMLERSRSTHVGSISTAQTRAPAARSERVSAPAPAPRSTTSSPGRRSRPWMSCSRTPLSVRKFCPSSRRRRSRSVVRRPDTEHHRHRHDRHATSRLGTKSCQFDLERVTALVTATATVTSVRTSCRLARWF